MNDDDDVEEFSKKYVVEKRLVTQYLEHLRELERRKKKREDSRKRANLEEKRKTFEDYNWKAIYREIGSDEDDIDSDDDEGQIYEGDAGEEEEEEENISDLLQTIRSGRVCRTWKGRASAIDQFT
ncbi:Hypothetical predicted protein [Paramuricea clavata]|uniref:Uncharacterized protein n=1 Tax=Paramuricea clavata TaxID=317549 RepID=A0A7D9HE25_PARCT|nr:Hypothetical predicted protein [Paramuricea clavata]